MRLRGHLVDAARRRRAARPWAPRADPGQRPVVGAAAPAQPQAAAVHRERGHDHQVGTGDGADAARRLGGSSSPRGPGGQRVRPLVRRPVQVVRRPQQRQQDVGAALPQRVDQAAGLRLGADRDSRRRPCPPSAPRAARAPRRAAAGPRRCARPRSSPRACQPQHAAARSYADRTPARHHGPCGPGSPCRAVSGVSRMADTAPTPQAVNHDAVTKAVIPAAGLGTRFLPATKATPKEMLPVVDKPAIQYVVEEAVSAGLDDVLMITGRGKRSIEDHFDRNYELEEALAAKDDERRAGPGPRLQRAREHALRPPGRPARAGSRGAVRGRARGRRAVRGAARRRHDRPPRPAAHPHDRGAASSTAAASSR